MRQEFWVLDYGEWEEFEEKLKQGNCMFFLSF
jgi:hypothetical protein